MFIYLFFYFQYPDYVDAYLRLAAMAKAQNNIQLSIELVPYWFSSFDIYMVKLFDWLFVYTR